MGRRGERDGAISRFAAMRSHASGLTSRWVLLALLADASLAIADGATARNAVLTTAYLVPPIAVALLEDGRRTFVVAFVSSLLAFLDGAWQHDLLAAAHLYRFSIVAGSGMLAVIGSVFRTRAVRARDRMGLLSEIARVADARASLDASLAALADVLVPAFADLCEIALVHDEALSRRVSRLTGAGTELERRLHDRPPDRLLLGATALESSDTGPRLIGEETLRALAGHGTGDESRVTARLRSGIVVRLRAGESIVALLVMAVGPSGRHYGSDDLAFAATVASRAALMIDNVRLFHELREARQRMEATVGSLADAVTIRDRSHHIVYANDAALHSMGFTTVEELRGREPRSLFDEYVVTDEHGERIDFADLPSMRLLAGEQPEPLLLRFVQLGGGEEHWRLLKAAPLYDADGHVEASVTIIEDVTVAKRAELQMAFLARASEILASSLDYEETLRNIAWLAVPEVADWCAVDLLDEHGERQQVVVAHRDPGKIALAERIREYEPDQLDETQGLGAALYRGESQLYPEIPPELLESAAVDSEHLRLLFEIGMRSALVVPLRAGTRIRGAMTWVSAESKRRFSQADVNFAEQVAARAAVAVENARLYTQRSQIASTLQQSLLPDALPKIEGWEIASLYRPARAGGGEVEVGGDFYDAFPTARGWVMLIGDVTGKGIEAAAMTSLVRHGARFVSEYVPDPAHILKRLDRALRQQAALSMCSALCMLIEGDRITLASAGHPLPLLVTDDGVRSMGASGQVLGAFADGEWPTDEFVLNPNEVLLMYTDGVTDTVGETGRFGEYRLHQTMAACGPLRAEELLNRLDEALSRFQVGPQADDTAALALRLAGRPVGAAPAASGREVG